MKIGVPKEIHDGEKRVATTPDAAEKIIKLGFEMYVETGAGAAANISDDAYREVGVTIVDSAKALWQAADIVMKVRGPQRRSELAIDELELIKPGQHLISFIWPAQNEELMRQLAAKNTTVLAMDSVPRMSRAQKKWTP